MNEVIGSIKSDATTRRMWRFVVRWMVLFFGVCVVWFVVAATQHLIAPMGGSRGRSITDEFPPVTESGMVLAVCMVITFQFGLLNHVPTSDIDTTNLTMERIAAWIVGAGLFVFSWVLTFTVEIGSGISPLAAWALKSVSSIAICMSLVFFYYGIGSITVERRRRSTGAWRSTAHIDNANAPD